MTERGAAIVRRLVRLGHRHPWGVLGAAVVVLAGGVALGLTIRFETDVLSLVPRHDPVVQRFKQALDEFGSLDTLLVAIPVRDGDQLEEGYTLADALATNLRKSPYLSHVDVHLDDPVRMAETVLRHAGVFLDAKGLDALGRRLTPEGLDARASDIRAMLETPHGMFAKDLLVRDPLGFLPLLLGQLSTTPASLKVDYASGYYLSSDHSMLLLLARPVRPAQDIEFDGRLMRDLRPRIERARRAVAKEDGVPLDEVPQVLLGGGHRTALEDASLIRRDIITNSMTSLVGVMLLFLFAYRRFSAVHYAFLPLAVGLALTFAFTAIVLGRLNSATAGFAALLVGLGIDFTIVMYGRYLEARHAGLGLEEALEVMAVHSGPAVALGAITTVGTFFSFLLTRFEGLRELGLLTGTGIVFMAVSAFLLLPALVTVFDRRRTPPAPSRWLDVTPVLAWSRRHRKAVLAVAVLLSAAAAALAPRIGFDDDVRNMRSASNRGVEIQQRVADAFGLSFNAMMIRVAAPDAATMMTRVQALAGRLEPLVASGTLSSYESLANLVPPQAAQERALKWFEEHPRLTDPARVRTELSAALARHGLVPQAFEPGLATLGEALRPAGPVTLDVWRGTPVERLIQRSLRVEDGEVVSVINVFSPPGMWRREAPPGLQALVDEVPGATLTGVNVVSQRLRHTVWQDAGIAGGVGLVVVLVLLLWELRSVRAALLCLLPVGIGVLWTIGGMAALGISLNLLNVFVVTMVIGVGVDYGIHMLHRLREHTSTGELGETGRAVVFAALTTIVGFGSLVTTHYPGLQSIGWMTSFGVLFSAVGAVVILPLVVRGRDRT